MKSFSVLHLFNSIRQIRLPSELVAIGNKESSLGRIFKGLSRILAGWDARRRMIAKTDLQKHVTVSSTSMEREVSMAEYLSTFLLPRPNIEPITLNTSRKRHNTPTALSQRITRTEQRNDWNDGMGTGERCKIGPQVYQLK